MMTTGQRTVSRARLLKGTLATLALASCSRVTPSASPNATPSAACGAVVENPLDPFNLNQILSNAVFAQVDKAAVQASFDTSAALAASRQPYLLQSQQLQTSPNIASIPSNGIVIRTPGHYVFTGDILWTPVATATSAVTIASADVTLDLAGHTLSASVPDTSWQTAGVLVAGTVSNVSIIDGTIASMTEYGIAATGVCGLTCTGVNVSGLCLNNINIRALSPCGLFTTNCQNVTISDVHVSGSNVTADSSAGILLEKTYNATVSACSATSLVNNDGVVQAFGLSGCINVTHTACAANNLQTHYNGNNLSAGHTCIGFCPVSSMDLAYNGCSAGDITGCCDDAHGMSVFLNKQVTVTDFIATNVTDGVAASNSGAKATGLEVYGDTVTISNCIVSNIHAINPQDLQSTGFSAWGVNLVFENCTANDVSVATTPAPSMPLRGTPLGIGFGWAPDPRIYFAIIGSYGTLYKNCNANGCDVAYDTWFQIGSTWTGTTYSNCTTGYLVQPLGTRTLIANACSECNDAIPQLPCTPPLVTPLLNLAFGNTYPSLSGARK